MENRVNFIFYGMGIFLVNMILILIFLPNIETMELFDLSYFVSHILFTFPFNFLTILSFGLIFAGLILPLSKKEKNEMDKSE